MRRALGLGAVAWLAVACSSSPTAGPSSSSITVPTTTAPVSSTILDTNAPSTAPAPTTATTVATTIAPTQPSGPPPTPSIALALVAQLNEPVAVAIRANDPRLFVAERSGYLRSLHNGAVDPAPILDISARTRAEGERGFLGFAFWPDGSHLDVDYTDQNGDSHIDEFTMTSGGMADPATRRQIIFQPQPYPNHNGGQLVFGPDGLLYIGFGDGGSHGDPQNRAQDLSTWLGKILRIDPHPSGSLPYTVPSDNPFVATAGAKPEIWSYGLRNPWRFTFDAANGDLWIGDVGQDLWEEIDWRPASSGAGKGVNFGWRRFEGTHVYNPSTPTPGAVPPIYDYGHSDTNGCSVTGGLVYRGRGVPALDGWYVYGDYCRIGLTGIYLSRQGDQAITHTALLGTTARTVVSFGSGPDGELYVCSLDGSLWRIVAG